jgi:hypothetical protein
MFYFLFLNIFRRHQRNFHFNPAHFDSGASPLFLLLGIGGFHLCTKYDALLLYIAPSAFTPSESVTVVIKDSRPVRRRRFDAAGANLQGIPLTPALAPPFFLLLLSLFWVEGGPARLRWMFLYRYVCVTSPTT